MKRWIRRTSWIAAAGVALLAILSITGMSLFRSVPDWYGTIAAGKEQRQKLAAAAENKLIEAQNWAAQVRADAARAARAAQDGATRPAGRAADTYDVIFSQDELNALFDKWSVLYGWNSNVEKYVQDPRLVLRDGRLILAGKVIDLGAVVSFHFRPSIDAKGDLRLDLVKVAGGRLPLPDVVWTPYRDDLAEAINTEMPRWRQRARIGVSGAANVDAMAATMGRLFLHVAQRQPAEAILFLPLADRSDSVPVHVKAVSIVDATLKLTVEPLPPDQRAALLQRIRRP